jgi:CRP/FNR family transcriptional regulator, cyclic AMP receptor protein
VPTAIVTVKRDTMLQLVREQKSVSTQFVYYLLARNYRIQQDLIDHIFNSSEKQLARTLLLLASYQSSKHDPSVLEAIRQQ